VQTWSFFVPTKLFNKIDTLCFAIPSERKVETVNKN